MKKEPAENLSAQLLSDARFDRDYLALLLAAAIMAALGLEQNSAATIIGAMVVAPLMLPIRAFGYGLLRLDRDTIAVSLRTIGLSVLLTMALGVLIGWLAQRPQFGSEILSRTSVTFLGLGVAFAGDTLSGLSRALDRGKITDSLVGVGISVSLVPPLCVAGITLAYGDLFEAFGASMIFLTNFIGIALACAVVFWLTGHATPDRRRTAAAFAVFALGVAAILPVLAGAGYRARQLSAIEEFMSRRGTRYLPSVLAFESTQISWEGRPEIVTMVRSTVPPTLDQVRRLNDAINRRARVHYHLTIVVDPAIMIAP